MSNHERFLYFAIAVLFTAAVFPGLLWIALPVFFLALMWCWR